METGIRRVGFLVGIYLRRITLSHNYMDIKGKLIHIGDIQTFDSGFQKRQVVIETEGEYPQKIPTDLLRDKTGLIDGYSVGDTVTLKIDLRGNEYNGKYYLNAVCWKIEGTPTAKTESDEYPF